QQRQARVLLSLPQHGERADLGGPVRRLWLRREQRPARLLHALAIPVARLPDRHALAAAAGNPAASAPAHPQGLRSAATIVRLTKVNGAGGSRAVFIFLSGQRS